MIGLNYQYTDMNSEQTYPEVLSINKTFSNLLPNLMFINGSRPKPASGYFTEPLPKHLQ